MKEWLPMRHAQKKFEILRCDDSERLTYIATYDKDEAVQKLIDQRLHEIKEREQ